MSAHAWPVPELIMVQRSIHVSISLYQTVSSLIGCKAITIIIIIVTTAWADSGEVDGVASHVTPYYLYRVLWE